MAAGTHHLQGDSRIEQGTDWKIPLVISSGGSPINITGFSFEAQIKVAVFVREIWTDVQHYLESPAGNMEKNFLKIAGDTFISDDGQQITRVGLTCTIFQPWRVQFEARAGPTVVECFVVGGSLVGDSGSPALPNDDGTNPIAASAFTYPVLTQSPSSTIENLTRVLTTSQFIALQKALGK